MSVCAPEVARPQVGVERGDWAAPAQAAGKGLVLSNHGVYEALAGSADKMMAERTSGNGQSMTSFRKGMGPDHTDIAASLMNGCMQDSLRVGLRPRKLSGNRAAFGHQYSVRHFQDLGEIG